ncbi:MAG: DUF937 domain-containing protein [Eubacteriales bacterium]|nr:DUF937 domain-containing protein [Eubacteriales bacterium]
MDLSKLLAETLLSGNTVSALSETSGAKGDQVEQVLKSALPTLLQGMQKNASTKEGGQSLSKAVSNHAKDDTSDISSFLKNVDIEDGEKILSHILGSNKNKVEKGVAKKAGLSSKQTSNILAAAAPLLLNLIGNKKEEEDQKEESDSGGILGILSLALFGGDDKKDDDNPLGDIVTSGIGALLGGGSGSGSQRGLLGSLSSLLGGGKKKPSAGKKPTSAGKRSAAAKPAAKKTLSTTPSGKKRVIVQAKPKKGK